MLTQLKSLKNIIMTDEVNIIMEIKKDGKLSSYRHTGSLADFIKHLTEEIWKPIKINNKETEYQFSNLGNIRSLKFGKVNYLKPNFDNKRGPRFRLYLGEKRYSFSPEKEMKKYFK